MGAPFVDLGTFRPPVGPERPVRAWVPAGDPVPRPLLVLFDGQNVFDDAGSFAGGWYAHHTADRLGERSPIVVGLANGGQHRVRELGTEVARFLDAIRTELVPRLEERFLLAAPERRVIGGASLGGLAALHAWLEHPETWGGALAMSPSLWFARGRLLRELEQRQLPATGKLYVDAGRREKGRMFLDAERLASVLTARGLGPDRLLWRPDARGTHHERHWRRRLPKALRFLFR